MTTSWVSHGGHVVTLDWDRACRRYAWWVLPPDGGVVVDRSREPGRRHRRPAIRDAKRVWPVAA